MKNAMKREYDFRNAKRAAAVAVPRGKGRITIRLDEEILAWFRQQAERGRRAQEPLEKTLRGVIGGRNSQGFLTEETACG
jgi:uncharacterized protein (DUF4415 family)